MDMTPYVATIEESLAAAAAAGDDETRRTAAALTAALEPAVRLAMMNALADLAAEASDALDDRVVELRLEGGEVRVAVSPALAGDEPSDDDSPPALDGGEPSRITLRLPEALKEHAERAAAAQGLSLNTWLTRAVQEAVRSAPKAPAGRPRPDRGHRVRGWVQG